MKSIRLKGSISGAVIALSILFGVGIASSSTAQAQYRNDRYGQDNRRDRNRDWRRDRARNRDRSRDRDRDGIDDRYERETVYGNNGRYGNGQYGNNGRYGNGQYGNNGRYGDNARYNNNIYQVAMNQGYQQGLQTGASDAQRGQSYNPQRSRYYKDAANGYNSSYGNRGQYQQVYRDGFLRGYEQGYRQYSGYGGYGNGRDNSRSRTGGILGEIFGRP